MKDTKIDRDESSAFADSERKNNAEAVDGHVMKNAIPAIYRNNNKSLDEGRMAALMQVEDRLRIHRSWISSDTQSHKNCDGRGIYVYELPPKFNKDILARCNDLILWIINLCKYISNDGFGEPIQKLDDRWYHTHQYLLEPIFHSRILKYPCRVYSENEAKLFYVPFYGGLDILGWKSKDASIEVKDSLSLELLRWLETQKSWFRNSGKDHVFVLGTITWDFRRKNDQWGTKFLELDQMQNPIKLLIERHPWYLNDIAIPYPTFFHPRTDDDIIKWQLKIIGTRLRSLVSFAGAARPGDPKSIRSMLIEQCISGSNNGSNCRFVPCNSGNCKPESLIELFMESEFCLQPKGDSATRKSMFDSLVSGCIPVVFDPFTAHYQYAWHLAEDHEKYSVFIDEDEVRNRQVNYIERLAEIPVNERENMRKYIVYELLPGLIYADSNSKLEKFEDAFSITMNNLFERANRF